MLKTEAQDDVCICHQTVNNIGKHSPRERTRNITEIMNKTKSLQTGRSLPPALRVIILTFRSVRAKVDRGQIPTSSQIKSKEDESRRKHVMEPNDFIKSRLGN